MYGFNYSLLFNHVQYLHDCICQGIFQNKSISDRQHTGFEYATELTVRHKPLTALMAELKT